MIIAICAVLIIALAIVAIFVLNIPKEEKIEELQFQGVVLDKTEGADGYGSLYLYNLDGGAYADQLCSITVGEETVVTGQDGSAITIQEIPADSIVRITHGDIVQEIYPANYPMVYKVEVVGPAGAGQLDKAHAAQAEWEASAVDPGDDSSAVEESANPEYIEPPADAALFRGSVESITQDGEETEIRLVRAAGTDYGMETMITRITADTRYGFDLAELELGNYLEIWYGVSPDGQMEDVEYFPAIVANLLPDASASVYNGTIVEITDNGDGTGRLLLQPIGDGQETLFSYDESTQFYLDRESMAVGDELNIYTTGIATMSLPPQAYAIEVRPYTAV